MNLLSEWKKRSGILARKVSSHLLSINELYKEKGKPWGLGKRILEEGHWFTKWPNEIYMVFLHIKTNRGYNMLATNRKYVNNDFIACKLH